MNYAEKFRATLRPTSSPGNGRPNGNGRPKTRLFEGFFTNPRWAAENGWRSMSKPMRMEKHFHPNLVFYHIGRREVLVPLRIKGAPEHAATLGLPLIEHYLARVEDTNHGRLAAGDKGVSQAWVAFANEHGEYTGETTIRQIADSIIEAHALPNEPIDPEFPRYYWIDAHGKVSTREAWLARVPDDVVY